MTDIRLKLSKYEADKILESLPMPREWWTYVARRFLELYHDLPAGTLTRR